MSLQGISPGDRRGMMKDKKELFRIAFLRSTYDSKYTAFCINDLRFGVDAGPWKVEFETSGRVEDLFRAIPNLRTLSHGIGG